MSKLDIVFSNEECFTVLQRRMQLQCEGVVLSGWCSWDDLIGNTCATPGSAKKEMTTVIPACCLRLKVGTLNCQ